jgi:multidrug efflux pump subunit AcrA (membrane-fusion protein)
MTVVAILAVGVGGWVGTTQLSGALIASGSIVVDTNVKKVQHPTGGVVGELRVRDGDRVKGGEIVVRLDETVTRSNLAIITKGLDELSARKARLSAERDGADLIAFPKQLTNRVGAHCGRWSRHDGALARLADLVNLRSSLRVVNAFQSGYCRLDHHFPQACSLIR